MAAGVWSAADAPAAARRQPAAGAPPARRPARARQGVELDDGEPARCLAACGGDPVRAIGALLSAAVSRVVESDVGFGVAPANATTLPWVVHTLVRALGTRIGAAAAGARGASAGGSGRRTKAQLLRAVAAGEGEGAAWAGSAPPSALLALLLEFLHALPRARGGGGARGPRAPIRGAPASSTPPRRPTAASQASSSEGAPRRRRSRLARQRRRSRRVASSRRRPPPPTLRWWGIGFGAAPSRLRAGGAQSVRCRHCRCRRAAVPAPAGGGLFGSPSAAAAPSPAPAPAGASPNPFAGFGAATAAPAAAPAAGSSPFNFTASNPTSPTAAAAPALPAPSFTSSHPTSPAAVAAAPADDGAARAAAAAASRSFGRARRRALVRYLVAALASLPDEPSVARVRIESNDALGGASSSAPAAATGPTGKQAPELLRVTGANSRNSSLHAMATTRNPARATGGRATTRAQLRPAAAFSAAPHLCSAAVSIGMAPLGRFARTETGREKPAGTSRNGLTRPRRRREHGAVRDGKRASRLAATTIFALRRSATRSRRRRRRRQRRRRDRSTCCE